ncbi:MAG: hypothetical protein RIM84_18845 [Alphaproteobacteria bacterium]
MKSLTLTTVIAATMVPLSTQAAHAQRVCAPTAEIAQQLENKFEEQAVGRGLTPGGDAMFELFVSNSGSWTVLISDPSGRSCVFAVGDNWHGTPLPSGDPA